MFAKMYWLAVIGVCAYVAHAQTIPPNNTGLAPTPTTPRECGTGMVKGLDLGLQSDNGEAWLGYGEFPWNVVIFKVAPASDDSNETFNVFLGGGSLIHMRVVLTAAHYVVTAEANTLRVRAGEWDMGSTKEHYPHQDRDVSSIEVHKDFIRGTLYYDAALLFLSSPVDPAPHINVVCLPPPKRLQVEGTRCFASGYGKRYTNDTFQSLPKKVEIPVVKHSTCQKQLRSTRLGAIFELHRSFMCAGGEPGVDTCKGDGGSALVCPMQYQPDRFVQAGIVAWGVGCGGGVPGVYSDTSVVRDFIDDKMAAVGLGDEMLYARY
ncbi:phenoloxidase-activating factor 2-like [Ostrinia nubilalis]|uniref:phenoloxidase-activating factor 2-like n=1 Tax=Ostrinia nubilalis TaxID=29057 RepID=UPI003082278D